MLKSHLVVSSFHLPGIPRPVCLHGNTDVYNYTKVLDEPAKEEAKYAVGDTVRVVAHTVGVCFYDDLPIGTETEIFEIDVAKEKSNNQHIKVKCGGPFAHEGYWLAEADIEPIVDGVSGYIYILTLVIQREKRLQKCNIKQQKRRTQTWKAEQREQGSWQRR